MRALWLVLGALAATTAVVVGVAAALVMGGGEDNENGPSEHQHAEAQTTGTPSGSTSGEALRLLGRDPITMDPACASDVESAAYIIEIFGGLVTIDRDLNTVPDIAEAIPEPVRERRRHRQLHLPGATGRPLPQPVPPGGRRRRQVLHGAGPQPRHPVAHRRDLSGRHRGGQGVRPHRRGRGQRHRARPGRPLQADHHHRRAQALLPGQADLPHGLRGGPQPDGRHLLLQQHQLAAAGQRHRPLQAAGVGPGPEDRPGGQQPLPPGGAAPGARRVQPGRRLGRDHVRER